MSTSDAKKIIRLRSADNKVFEVEEAAMLRSAHIKHMIEDNCHNDIIPLFNIQSGVLAKVIDYCNKHSAVQSKALDQGSSTTSGDALACPTVDGNEELEAWDSKLVDLDYQPLFELIMAANFLDIKDLLDLTTQAVADKIKDKQPEEVRRIFNIENDFTPEEEQALRDQYSWAYKIDE